MYKLIIKPFLFLFSPESAHQIAMKSFTVMRKLGLGGVFSSKEDKRLEKSFLGLTFKNPIGIAAGFDKNGDYIENLDKMGFGFIEVGTVTPIPQIGNPKPRLFRLPEDNALINRMGFNNLGVDYLVENLKKLQNKNIVIGGNIGKNKDTPNEKAIDDYEICFQKLFPYVDYFVINISSPNTPNLRALQDKKPLTELLTHLQKLNHAHSKSKPILLKIAPDLSNEQLDDIIEIVQQTKLAGIIATNTTISRSNLTTSSDKIDQIGNGGLSGKPLKQRSTEVVRYIHTKTNGNLTIIGVGGISSPKDAVEKMEAGASLIQLFSGFIFEGPTLVERIKQTFQLKS